MVQTVEIIDFDPRYRADFHALNIEWLERYFVVEPIDRQVLSDPEQHILLSGGTILFARVGQRVVGTGALKHQGSGIYELTKMGVTRDLQRAGVGAKLIEGLIEKFLGGGGKQLFLETSSLLKPAIKLYERYGFIDQQRRKPDSVYQRSDVYMVWDPSAPRPNLESNR